MTASTIYLLSIDPGKTGSASILKTENGAIHLERVLAFGLKRNAGNWEEQLRDLCFVWQPDHIVMERVHAFASDTRRKAFAFGGNRRAVIVALKFARRTVDIELDPQAWQRRLGLPHNRHLVGKDARRKQGRKDQEARAIQLYPVLATTEGDIFASVLIGYAAALDLLGIQRGMHAQP